MSFSPKENVHSRLALAVCVVVVAPGCDLLFGTVCTADSDCADPQPFCVLGTCSEEDGPVRAEGEGEDGEGEAGEEGEEGEGEVVGCASDDECSGGACYDVSDGAHFDADLVGTCVPGPDDDSSCPEANAFSAGGGPVLFGLNVVRGSGDGCAIAGQKNLNISVLFFDRGDRAFDLQGSVFVVAGSNTPLQTAGSISYNSGDLVGQIFAGFGDACVDDSVTVVAVAAGITSPVTNGLCAVISEPAP